MYLIEDKGGAIALMMAALLFLGTWPAIVSLQERRGRLPQHTFLDYTIANLTAAVLIALTFGQIGDSQPNQPNFFTQLSQENWPSILFALAGGIVLCLGYLSSQYAWAYVGLAVTEVITCSITVVIGTTMNYFLDGQLNKAEVLFPGVGCFLIAVFLGAAVHSSNEADNKEKLSNCSSDKLSSAGAPGDYKNGSNEPNEVGTRLADVAEDDVEKDVECGSSYESKSKTENSKAGTAEYLLELEMRRSIKVFGSNRFVGLSLVFFASICFALFSPAFNLATNDQWNTLKEGVPNLVVYTAFFYFAVSFFVLGIGLNIIFLYRPILGVPKSSFKAYISDWNGRKMALLAGFLCSFGNGFQFMGGQAAGYAAADSVQALPLVSTFWAVVIFREYRKSSKKTYILLACMLLMFIASVAILMASSGDRHS
ncbi:Ureide permease 2 [Platanthera zijinensis]|uniref:Ureide permease 2 n=1 Tax=Platanthera zijinensis TaxID=2320716 RepID=A0AAP0BQX3_9ASPA